MTKGVPYLLGLSSGLRICVAVFTVKEQQPGTRSVFEGGSGELPNPDEDHYEVHAEDGPPSVLGN
jgi:hypothetical protein